MNISMQSAMNNGASNLAMIMHSSATVYNQLSQGNTSLTQADFSSALSQVNGSSTATKQSEALFVTLDADSNGELTETEFSKGFADMIYNRQGSLQGRNKNMPPPPPRIDAGKSADQLSEMLQQVDADSQQSSNLTALLDNFAAADTDGDGKLTFQESGSWLKQQEENNTSTNQRDISQALQRNIMQLTQSYSAVSQNNKPLIEISA